MRVKIIKSGLLISSISILLLLSGCSRKEKHTGVVGNFYSITVKAPLGVDDPTFRWAIVEIPEKSQLSFSDLIIIENGKEMTFQPDEAGNYTFELIVFNVEGEETASQTYEFLVEATPAFIEKEGIKEEIEEIVVSEQIPDTLLTVEIVEEEFVQDTSEPAYAEVATVETENIPQKVSEEEHNFATEPLDQKAEVPISDKPQKATVSAKAARGRKIPKVEGKFTVQVSSWPTIEKAQAEAEELLALGFDTYIQKAYFEETNEIWYRVRVGSFSDRAAASQAASEISSVIKKNTWIDHVRMDFQ